MCVCVFVRACVRACVRVCVHVCKIIYLTWIAVFFYKSCLPTVICLIHLLHDQV